MNARPSPPPELQWVYDTAPIGLAFLSSDCRYLYINQRLTEICGISVADHIGRSVREMVPNIADAVEGLVQSIVENGEPVTGIEVTGQRTDNIGSDRCWLTNWYPLKGPDGRVLGVNVAAEEITERKRAQVAVEGRWRSVFETSTLGISLTGHDLKFVETNSAFQAMLGYSAEELRKLSPADLMPEEEREAARTRLLELRDGKHSNYEVVTRYRRKDGTIIWVNTFVSTIPGNKSDPPVFLATAIDITDRHHAERELRRTATYLAEAEKLSHTGCWARNTKSGELFWSPEEWRIFGLDPATTRLSYQVFLELVHPEDRTLLEEESRRAVREKRAYSIPFRAVLRDGTIKHIHSVGKPIFEESGDVVEYIGVSMDETERKRGEAALHEAQAELARVARLTTMGELAAAIAHEINQPLAAVVTNGNASLRWLARDTPNLEEAQQAVNRIVKEANRASDVIGRIRTLLRNDKPEFVGLNINDAIRDVLTLAQSALQSRGVSVRTELPAGLPPVLGDRVQLQQVIMNLIINGADAMQQVTDRPRVVSIRSRLDTDSVQVAVEDSGTGLDASMIGRIFDPLFTTKPNGMGMGLSICRSIVEAHGGRLEAANGACHGAVFQFSVPTAAISSKVGD
jgi:PAS domain S-box-containing protein